MANRNAEVGQAAVAPLNPGTIAGAFEPQKRIYYETIGGKDYALEESYLHIDNDVALWESNPRIMHYIGAAGPKTEDEIAAQLRRGNGYDVLRQSIENQGQMTPVYAWKSLAMKRYIVIEGNTRLTVLRELRSKHLGTPNEANYEFISAKVLPPSFTEEDIVLLLVGIHVRGAGVRDWDRYVQAKTVHDAVTPHAGKKPVTTLTKLAAHMGHSVSWVSRLLAAYKFAKAYVEHHDTPEAPVEAVKYFSILEEISKSANFGAKVRDFDNPIYDELRGEVFQMVQRGVFSEYRDARHMQEFHNDADKWALLKTLEPGIAKKIAAEINAGTSNLGSRISSLPEAIKKTLVAKPDALSEEHLEHLQESVGTLGSYLTGVSTFILQLNAFKKSLKRVTLEDLGSIPVAELDDLVASLQRIRGLANQPPVIVVNA